MKVSTRLMLALCATIWVFMGALLALHRWQGRNIQSVLLDRSDAISRLSEKTIELVGKPLRTQSDDYSFWTEMVDFVRTGDPQWAKDNLAPSFMTFDVDALWVCRPDAAPVYFETTLADRGIGDALPLKGQAEKLFAKSPFAHFFFRTPAGLMEVCGATIHPTEDTERKTPAAGYLFVGRLCGRAYLEELSSLLDGTASLMQDGNLAAIHQGTVLEGGAMVFRHPLNAWDGTPLAVLELRTFSPIVERFSSYLNWEPAVVGVFCLALLAVLSALLMRWVTLPLRMLSAALANGDPAALSGLERDNSEYGNIARLVTRHFSQSRALVREMAERIRFEEAQAFLIRCGHAPGEGDFFQALAKYLSGALGMDFICIDRLLPDGLAAQTVAVHFDGKFEDNVCYALKDTPCGDVVGKPICCFPCDVRHLFPNDTVLQEMQAESYAGTTLWSSDGRPIGLIAAIGRKPMTDTKRIEAILQLVAVRAAGELERRQAEDELRKSEANLSSLLNAIHESVFLIDLEGVILVANATFAERLGRTVEECVGESVYALLPGELAAKRREKIDELIRTGRPVIFEDKRHDRWMFHNVFPVFNAEHAIVRIVIYAMDVTERRQAEEALRENQQWLELAQSAGCVGIFDWDMAANETRWSGELKKILGLPDGGDEVTYEEWAKHVHPEDLARIEATVAGCAASGTDEMQFDYRFLGAGGECWIAVRGRILRDGAGKAVRVIGTNVDVTGRKQAEEALRASQARYRSLFESAKDGILVLDAVSGGVVDANPSVVAMLDCSREQLIGRELWEIGAFRDIASSRWAFEQLIGGDDIHYDEVSLIREDGAEIPVEFMGTVYRAGDEQVVQCNIREISERKRLEDQLRQAQKMDAMGQFAGGIAHDFNNLLQVILGNVGLVQRMQPPGAPTWDEVDEVRRAAERAAELTQQLLAFSRRQTIQPVNLDLNQLIEGVLNMLRRLIGERVELCFIPGDALERVRADRGQIEQAIMNMSVNARDAMPRGGKLTIRTENAVLDGPYCLDHPWAAEGRYALITVTDTGRGMDAETRTRVFEPFYTTKEVGQGTGLGLATVYGIVKQHNGLIHVDSVPQKGTIFSLYLPAVESPAEEGPESAKQPVWGGNETILVAEDEPAVLHLITSLLETVGYHVLSASDGNEAVRVFEEHCAGIDLAVLDVVMPGLSGREAMERMRAKSPGMLFLFSSGYSPSSIHKDFIVEEGLHLLRKPYRREDLLLAVRQILDTRDAPAPPANDEATEAPWP